MRTTRTHMAAPGRATTRTAAGPRIVAVWFPWWPTERLARSLPESRTRPFCTITEIKGKQVIAAVNPCAARAGLKNGMSLADGRAVAPAVSTRPADPVGDALALERLARWADRFAPRVMADGLDTIFLDIAGCAHLFSGEKGLAATARGALEGFGLTVKLGLADTLGAAWALARHGADNPASASHGAGPCELRDILASLPVAALRLDPKVVAELTFFGLNRIGSLYDIDSSELVRRFGVQPAKRLRQALGLEREPLTALRPPPPRTACRTFAEPISTAEAIGAALNGLLDDLCGRLRCQGEGVRELRLVFRTVDGNRQALGIGTSRPLRRQRRLAKLFADKLEEVDPGFGIEEMLLVAEKVETVVPVQAEWFGDASRARPCHEDEKALADLLDRLGNRLGFDRIVRPAPRQSWLPELAVARARNNRVREMASWPSDRIRPLRLLSPPEPVEAVVRRAGGSPVGFRRRGRAHRLRAVEGPERIDCEWWQEDAPCRDYYLAEDEAGGRYWLYAARHASPGSERWFLHGIFA